MSDTDTIEKLEETARYADATRRRLAHDPHRPLYHFLPPANWMNDPNGLIQWQGQYHMFYQCNPENPYWGEMHWGHAVSSDLIHWTDLPIALAPTPGAADHFDCFSGCAVDDAGVPTLIYTGISEHSPSGVRHYPVPVEAQVQCITTSDDGLVTWKKHAGNPVITTASHDLDVIGFRDPFVWREDGQWQALIGAGVRGVGGTALRYCSDDLRQWEYAGPLMIGDSAETGSMWECPNFFSLGDRHVLVVSASPPRGVRYMIGTYDDGAFTMEKHGVLHGANCFYAPLTMRDDGGRRLMFGWLREERTDEAQRSAGWAGVMSLPQVLTCGGNGGLWIEPAKEVETLRERHWQWRSGDSAESPADWLTGIQGDCLEIVVRVAPACSGAWGLSVRRSPDGEEETRIVYDPASREVRIGRQRASLDPDAESEDATLILDAAVEDVDTMRVFLDRSVLEVYAGGRCLTGRIYPTRPDSVGLGLIDAPGNAHIQAIDVWSMRSVWPAG